MPYKPLLLLALAGLAAAALWHGRSASVTVSAAAVDALSPPASGDAWLRSADSSLRSDTGAARQGGMSARAGFEAAEDLYAYRVGLTVRERAGDPEALWLVSRVYEYCMGYATNPTGYMEDTRAMAQLKLPATAALVAARERVRRRCARFVPADELSPPLILAKRLEAAEAGSVVAEASLLAMGTPLSDRDDYKKDLVRRVLISRDPEAYVAVSPAMGIAASGEEDSFGEVSGSSLSELAWVVAACRLGQECGPDGSLMTAYCANGGICSRDDSQDFSAFVRDAGVPRQGVETLDEMVNTLLDNPGVVE